MRNCSLKRKNKGFTLMEMIIVISIISILIGLASVGISRYMDMSDQLRRTEVAENAYYSLQSYVNYMKRQGQLEDFNAGLLNYNKNTFGMENILSEGQNKTIIESNYDGTNSNFYNDEYLPAHTDSQIIILAMNNGGDGSCPLYPILYKYIDDEETLLNSFLVEYDLYTGVVRSVFYSEDADSLTMHFGDSANWESDINDCILRSSSSLSEKKQGYYGVTFTSAECQKKSMDIIAPTQVKLVNNDRLYLVWREENADSELFLDETYDIDYLAYNIILYNGEGDKISTFKFTQGEMYNGVPNSTEPVFLADFDDLSGEILSHADGNEQTGGARKIHAGVMDYGYEKAPFGVAGQYCYVLLECLDHKFGDNGYDFSADDEIFASVEVYYDDGSVLGRADGATVSNTESVFYQYVQNEALETEFGIACNRHLWNIRKGFADGAYRVVSDIDWSNIEDRGKNIEFNSIYFEDDENVGLLHGFKGTFSGQNESGSTYVISALAIRENNQNQVGFFGINEGNINNISFKDMTAHGASQVGTVAGRNKGTITNVNVLNADVSGRGYIGGITGYCEGNVSNCGVAADVYVVLPGDRVKISTHDMYGRYVGGVIGYLASTGSVSKLYSGVLFDSETNTFREIWNVQTGGAALDNVVSCQVNGIQHVGGIIGEIENGIGEISNLYNYAKVNVTYVSTAEREDRSDTDTDIYLFFGGIVGRNYSGNTLVNCGNFAPVAPEFMVGRDAVDNATARNYSLINTENDVYSNQPRYIGGIAGINEGTIKDCLLDCDEYKSLTEEIEEYKDSLYVESSDVLIGVCVGGVAGYQQIPGSIIFTEQLAAGQFTSVVRAFDCAGGIVGQQLRGSITNQGSKLTLSGVIASNQENAGGVAAYIYGGTLEGAFENNAVVFGECAGGIVGFLAKGVSISDCNNTGYIFARGLAQAADRGYIGGIAGINYGSLNNCSNSGTVSSYFWSENVPETYMPSGITATAMYADVGGVVGKNSGTVNDCHSNKNMIGTNYIAGSHLCNVGGLVGYNDHSGENNLGAITHTGKDSVDVNIFVGRDTGINVNYANKVGGVVGLCSGLLTISDYTYGGTLTVIYPGSYNGEAVGGIIGELSESGHVVNNCSLTGSVISRTHRTGGIVGYMSGGVVGGSSNLASTGVVEGTTCTGGIVGYFQNGSVAGTCYNEKGASVTGGTSVGGIVGMSVGYGSGSYIYVLENNASVQGNSYVGGLAGYVTNDVAYKMNNAVNKGNVTALTTGYVGGLAGFYLYNTTTGVDNAVNYGKIYGTGNVGGLIGSVITINYGTDATGYFVTNCTNNGDILGGSSTGGLIGSSSVDFTFEACENNGVILPYSSNADISYVGGIIGNQTAKTLVMSKCNNNGRIYGSEAVGGLIGRLINSASTGRLEITDCINYAEVDGTTSVGGICGTSSKAEIQITNCGNYGNIGYNLTEGKTVNNAGGIIGFVYQPSDAAFTGAITGCTQFANIKNVAGTMKNDAGGAGGIVGGNRLALTITDCTYGDATHKFSIRSYENMLRAGGIIGLSYYRGSAKIQNCTSYADLIATNTDISEIEACGGIAGQLHKDSEVEGCAFYGKIEANGTVRQTGGILGIVGHDSVDIDASDLRVSECTFEGNINSLNSSLYMVGGIVGRQRTKINTLTFEKCTVNADLTGNTRAEYVGGILGVTETNAVFGNSMNAAMGCGFVGNISSTAGTMNACGGVLGAMPKNNSPVATAKIYGTTVDIEAKSGVNMERVGGFIGHVSAYGKTDMIKCDSVIDIQAQSGTIKYAGGLIGYTESGVSANNCSVQGSMYTENDMTYAGGFLGWLGYAQDGTAYFSGSNFQGSFEGKNLKYVSGAVASTYIKAPLTFHGCNINASIDALETMYYCGLLAAEVKGDLYIGDSGDTSKKNYVTGNLTSKGKMEECGGIVGRLGDPVEDSICIITDIDYSGKLESTEQGQQSVGGLVAIVLPNTDAYMYNCNYSGTIKAKKTSQNIGGLIGDVDRNAHTEIGKNDISESYCTYSGDINNDEKIISAGGFVGKYEYNDNAEEVGYIYGGENNHGKVRGKVLESAGGIVGNIGNNRIIVIEDVNAYSEVSCNGSNAEKAGGVIGNIADGVSVSMKNLKNTSAVTMIVTSGYHIGGYIGGVGPRSNVYFDNCENSAVVYAAATVVNNVGGYVGNQNETQSYVSIRNSSTRTTVNMSCASAINIGGFVGRAASVDIDNIVNYNNVTCSSSNAEFVGGFLGNCYGENNISITNIEYRGNVLVSASLANSVGGAIGNLAGKETVYLEKFTHYGDISCSASTNQNIGGYVGSGTAKSYVTIHDCQYYGTLKCKENLANNIGGYMGYLNGDSTVKITKCDNRSNMTFENNEVGRVSFFVGALYGANVQIGELDEAGNITNICRNYGGITFTKPILAYYIGGFIAYSEANSNIDIYGAENYANLIPANGSEISDVGGIGGYLYGNINMINCSQNAEIRHVSCRGNVAAGGIVANLQGGTVNLVNCRNTGSIDIETSTVDGFVNKQPERAGGIVGYNKAVLTMKGCENRGNISVSDGKPAQYVGGLVGYTSGENDTYTDCSNTGNISGNITCAAGGIARINAKKVLVSGFKNSGNISGNSYVAAISASSAEKDSSLIMDCVNTGTIIGNNYVAGLCASYTKGMLVDCYNLGNVTGTDAVGNLVANVGNEITVQIIDCYYGGGANSALAPFGRTKNVGCSWQAAGAQGGTPILNQTVYNQLCDAWQITKQWDAGYMPNNAAYLIENYRFVPSEFEITDMEYVNDIFTYSVSYSSTLGAYGLGIALYPMDMSDEDILNDLNTNSGGNAFVLFTDYLPTGNIPASIEHEESITLPASSTGYKVALTAIGPNGDGGSLNNTPWKLQGFTLVINSGFLSDVKPEIGEAAVWEGESDDEQPENQDGDSENQEPDDQDSNSEYGETDDQGGDSGAGESGNQDVSSGDIGTDGQGGDTDEGGF